jgi:carboxypeptidase family protein
MQALIPLPKPAARWLAVLFALWPLLAAACLPSRPAPTPPRNVRGLHTVPHDTLQAAAQQLDWVRAFSGPGGHVTQVFYPVGRGTSGPSDQAVRFVEAAYARDLDPILRLQGDFVNAQRCDASQVEGWVKPLPDDPRAASPRYTAEASGYRAFVAGLPRRDGRTLYVEVWNEPNLNEQWSGTANAAEYARFFVDVAVAIRSIGDPRIRVLNGALAPEGDIDNLLFLQQALQTDTAFAHSFDLWASHPYPHNQPPNNNLHDGTALPGSRYTIDSYLLEGKVLADYAVDLAKLGVVITETGYELGDAWYPDYPTVEEDNRAAYTWTAFEQFWPRWPEVRAVTAFELSDPNGWWAKSDWVRPASESGPGGLPTQPRLQYARLIPGTGIIGGTVWSPVGEAVPDVELTTSNGGYRSKTASDGGFVLVVAPGRYDLTLSRPGYVAEQRLGVAVQQGEIVTLDLSLAERLPTTLQNPSFEAGDLSGWTAWGAVGGVQRGPWLADVIARDRAAFFGSAGDCEAKDGGLYQTVAAQVGENLKLSAWLLTYREGPTPIGNRIGLDPRGGHNPQSEGIVWSPLIETDGKWRRVNVAANAQADRVTVFLEHDQARQNRWNVSAFDGVAFGAVP